GVPNASDLIDDRHIGPATDEDAADLLVTDDLDSVVGVFDSHHQQLCKPLPRVEAVEIVVPAGGRGAGRVFRLGVIGGAGCAGRDGGPGGKCAAQYGNATTKH